MTNPASGSGPSSSTGSNQLRLRAELKRLEGEGGGELGALVSARVARSLAGRTGILHLSRFRTDSYITRMYSRI